MLKRINALRIGTKLPLIMTLLVAITIVVMTIANVLLTDVLMKRSAAVKLEGLAYLKAKRIESLMQSIERDVRLTASAPMTSQALLSFADGFSSLNDAYATLRRVYITDNEFPLGEKDNLVSADTGSSYGFIHSVYHPTFDNLQNEMGYYDIFLFDVAGNLIYSVFKENDFATNMLTGEWGNSGLAEAFRRAVEMAPDDQTTLVDFAPYEPSNFAPAAFMSRPVFDAQGTLLGVFAIQMPVGKLNEAASEFQGLGETADGFIVGADHLMRTDSQMTENDDILSTRVEVPEVKSALEGQEGNFVSTRSNGEKVMGFAIPLEFNGVRWAGVLQQNTQELLAGRQWALSRVGFISLVVFLGALLVSVSFARSISRPVQNVAKGVNAVAEGNLAEPVQEGQRGDEIGDLARAAEVFRLNAMKMKQLSEEQAASQKRMTALNAEREKNAAEALDLARKQEESDRAAVREREAMMDQLGTSFGEVVTAAIHGRFSERVDASFEDANLIRLAKNINMLMEAIESGLSHTGKVIEKVAGGDLTLRMEGEFEGAFLDLQTNVNAMIDSLTLLAGDISESGMTLSGSSAELRQTADQLSRQAEQNAASVEETSAALEELSASLKNASRNVAEVSTTADKASASARSSGRIAEEAALSMDRIASGSTEIARVTAVINDIAFQINLLALNAGVEAARAGEAGRGFSVVASEVRQLAQRASNAAREISDVIKQSDEAVAEGVTKVAGAKSSLEEIAHSVIRISESVTEVKTAISEQSAGIGEITSSVAQIDSNTQKQAAAFEEVTASSTVLAEEARELKTTTERFKINALTQRDNDAAIQDTSGNRSGSRPVAA